jgi:FKBP-type peptidyl-prolyl cis-trans isomerase
MKAILLGALAILPAFSAFSEDLITKYSIQVLAEGEAGTTPTQGQEVNMHYEGTLKDGTKFDSSYDRGQPLDFNIGVNQVIRCWD